MDIGDIVTLGRLGKKLLTKFLALTFVVSVLSFTVVGWLFPISTSVSGGTAGFQSILSMVFATVPANIISPFLDGNTLQLIFLGLCVGVAFLLLGEHAIAGTFLLHAQLAQSTFKRGVSFAGLVDTKPMVLGFVNIDCSWYYDFADLSWFALCS